MFSSRLYKYRYYSLNQLILEFKEFNNFIYYCTKSIKIYYNDKIKKNIYSLIKVLKNYVFLLKGVI